MLVTESIKAFLSAQPVGARELIDRYHAGLECQVLVTPGANRWPIRIPKQANTSPTWRDYRLKWDIADCATAIGFTGWDWQAKRSVWVGFDFDAITGHAPGVGLGADQLQRVREAAAALPYVEVRRSTGGQGYHLYCYVDAETANHTEHAALARAVLADMSRDAGFDFCRAVDACGSILWVWRRDMPADGLTLVKPSSCPAVVPTNWRDHLDVVARRSASVRLPGDDSGISSDLTAAYARVPLDDTHRAIISALAKTGYVCSWVADHHLLQTHTAALKQVHSELKLRGDFHTNSPASDPATANCFCFPRADGAFRVFRFGKGLRESSYWQISDRGYTYAEYNTHLTLAAACRVYGGHRSAKGWIIPDYEHFQLAMSAVGVSVGDNPFPSRRPVRVEFEPRTRSWSAVVGRIKHDPPDTAPGWVARGFVSYELRLPLEGETFEVDLDELDGQARIVHANNQVVGYFLKTASDSWLSYGFSAFREGFKRINAEPCDCQLHPWKHVNLPFRPEYPGDRQWNYNAPQLRYSPTDDEEPHPHWDLVFSHAGRSLDGVVNWGHVQTGRDYLIAYVAAMFRDPFCHLPYLFFYGPENSGKSMLWESIALLTTGGVVSADRALTCQSGFNGELANAVLCVVEETNIAKHKAARERIRAWVTSPEIQIHKKHAQPYQQANTCHFMQFANSVRYVPVFPGDTRITLMHVPPPGREIAKPTLVDRLKAEAPAFMRTLVDFVLPPAAGRLRVPVVHTAEKAGAQDSSATLVDQFITERCLLSSGDIALVDFAAAFRAWLPPEDRGAWKALQRIAQDIPGAFAVVKRHGQHFVEGLQLAERLGNA